MSVKHQFLPPGKFGRPSRHAWLLALGLALAPVLAAPVWAENFNLESVDFTNNDAGMRIILHTGSIVPVQKVLISENKLVLDIDQVNAGETVRTNFAGASNVSHVIVQPLNDHKVRMIIRGEGLSAPTVAFYGAGSESGGLSAEESARLSAETNAAWRRQQEAGLQSAVNNHALAKNTNPESVAVDHSPLKDDDAPLAFGGFVEDKSGQQTSSSHPGKLDLKPSETGPLALHSPEPTTAASNDFMAQIGNAKWGNYIPYGLLAMVLLGAGAFVRYKLTNLNPATEFEGAEYDDFADAPKSGKRTSFREMADAYRNKHEDKRATRGAGADSMIGLRGLNQQTVDEAEAARPTRQASPIIDEPMAPNTLEQILAAMQSNKPKKPMGGVSPAPKKQSVNQYAQIQSPNAQAAKTNKPKNRQAADEAMLQEMKRAQSAQQELQQQIRQNAAAEVSKPGYTPVNRAAMAKKAVKTPTFQTVPPGNAVNAKKPAAPTKSPIQSANTAPDTNKRGYTPVTPKPAAPAAPAAQGQAALSGNPEVLNFLRNVADLMEKDGKGEIAKSIHKNLGSKNINSLTQ